MKGVKIFFQTGKVIHFVYVKKVEENHALNYIKFTTSENDDVLFFFDRIAGYEILKLK